MLNENKNERTTTLEIIEEEEAEAQKLQLTPEINITSLFNSDENPLMIITSESENQTSSCLDISNDDSHCKIYEAHDEKKTEDEKNLKEDQEDKENLKEDLEYDEQEMKKKKMKKKIKMCLIHSYRTPKLKTVLKSEIGNKTGTKTKEQKAIPRREI